MTAPHEALPQPRLNPSEPPTPQPNDATPPLPAWAEAAVLPAPDVPLACVNGMPAAQAALPTIQPESPLFETAEAKPE